MQIKIEETGGSVELMNWGQAPDLQLIVAAAKTCYSEELPLPEDITDQYAAERLARSVFKSGHHTLFQHPYFTFAIDGVSRLAVWSFFHSTSHYNTSQQSQRYVSMDKAGFVIPPLSSEVQDVFTAAVDRALSAYQKLVDLLILVVDPLYKGRYNKANRKAVKKVAMEAARYVLPLATRATMYYTVNFLTLLRLHYMCNTPDTPWEQKLIADAMKKAVLAKAPDLEMFFHVPIRVRDLPTWKMQTRRSGRNYIKGFDRQIGLKSAALVGTYESNQLLLAQTVCDKLFGYWLEPAEAVRNVLDPYYNNLLAERLSPEAWSPLLECMRHQSYSFLYRISHTAVSQLQRHRMVPAQLQLLSSWRLHEEPDYITPELIKYSDKAYKLYKQQMVAAWEAVQQIESMPTRLSACFYLLPNAVTMRGRHSGDLLSFHHFWKLRTCYNAQREIWRLAMEEVRQVKKKDLQIGQWIGPPCELRYHAGLEPYCPEGPRFCGVKVWEIPFEERERVI